MENLLIYFSVFLSGIAATCFYVFAVQLFKNYKGTKQARERDLMQKESGGWIKIKNKIPLGDWRNRHQMTVWIKQINPNFELATWLNENTEGGFNIQYSHGAQYIKFDKETDAVAFKLRWH